MLRKYISTSFHTDSHSSLLSLLFSLQIHHFIASCCCWHLPQTASLSSGGWEVYYGGRQLEGVGWWGRTREGLMWLKVRQAFQSIALYKSVAWLDMVICRWCVCVLWVYVFSLWDDEMNPFLKGFYWSWYGIYKAVFSFILIHIRASQMKE